MKEIAAMVMIVTTMLSGVMAETDGVVADEKLPSVYSMRSGKKISGTVIKKYGGVKEFFRVYKIRKGGKVYKRIRGRSLPKKGYSAGDLRYVKVLYRDFKGKARVGELVVNKRIAGKARAIFYKLYKKNYQIRKMKLIDDYFPKTFSDRQAAALKADENSMNADNTSAFNYRTVAGSGALSSHAEGYSIDVNPFENPWVPNGRLASNQALSKDYADRTIRKPHMIFSDSYITKVFKKYGFRWGGEMFADYQHFQY